jgi:hypothetical protein
MALIEFIALILVSTSGPPERVMKSNLNTIRISNVCINIRHGYEYTVVSKIDYFRINVSYEGAEGYIYVGHNPEILDSNRKWQSRSLRSKMTSSKIVALEGEQVGQVLGVPLDENDQYFHLWFKSGNNKYTGLIKELVRFCE